MEVFSVTVRMYSVLNADTLWSCPDSGGVLRGVLIQEVSLEVS